MLVDFGKANPIEKARQQPDKVRMVVDKIRTDGLLPTLDAVRKQAGATEVVRLSSRHHRATRDRRINR